jgi:hypothetical protein
VILIVAGFAAGGVAGIVLPAVGGAALLAIGAYSTALNQVYRANPFRPRRAAWPEARPTE